MENILKIFNAEDETELRAAFKEIIKEQFQQQLRDMDLYLFDSSVIDEMIVDAFEDVINQVKLEFKARLREKVLSDVNLDKILKKINKI